MTMLDSLRQLVLSGEVRGAQARRLLLGALPGWHVRLGSPPMSIAPAAFTDWRSRIPVSSSPSRLSLDRHHEHHIAENFHEPQSRQCTASIAQWVEVLSTVAAVARYVRHVT
jgi:hypothetical protein